eukprot:364389-Chlamydomonas_euryale.AAC.2
MPPAHVVVLRQEQARPHERLAALAAPAAVAAAKAGPRRQARGTLLKQALDRRDLCCVTVQRVKVDEKRGHTPRKVRPHVRTQRVQEARVGCRQEVERDAAARRAACVALRQLGVDRPQRRALRV